MARLRAALKVVVLLAAEAGFLVALYKAGPALGSVPFTHLSAWLQQPVTQPTLTAVGRLVGLAVGWWLLVATVVSIAAGVGSMRQSSRGWRLITLPLVRKLVEGAAGVSMLVSTAASGVGGASAATLRSAAVVQLAPGHLRGAGSSATVAAVAGAVVPGAPAPSGAGTATLRQAHLPHPGQLDETPPAVTFFDNRAAPGPDNGFVGLAAGTPVYVVQKGDCLSVVADRLLKDWRLDDRIFDLNKGLPQRIGVVLTEEHWIYPGQVLVLPPEAAGAPGVIVVGATPGGVKGFSVPPTVSSAPTSQAPAPTASTIPRAAIPPAPADPVATNPTKISRAAARHSGVVPLPFELLGAGILAAGLVALIRRRTDAQRARRRFGRRIPRPTGEQARVELAARMGADEAGAEFVDVGLRFLARGLRTTDSPTPDILGAELHTDRLVVLLAEAGHTRPPGFEPGEDEMSWMLPRFDDDEALADLVDLVDDIVAPLPTMVTIGRSGDDSEITVMMNPESVGIISLAGDIVAARQVVASIAVELATAAWSQLARVYLVGFGRADGLGDTDPTILAASVEECLPALRAEAAERQAHARHDSKASAAELRIQGEGADLGPSLVLCMTVPDQQTLDELDELTSDPTCGVAAVIAGDVGDTITRGWALELDDQDLIEVGPLGRQVNPQFVSYRILEAIEGRIAVATDPDDVAAAEPAAHWYPPEADLGDHGGDDDVDGLDDLDDVDRGERGELEDPRDELEDQEDPDAGGEHIEHADQGQPAVLSTASNGAAHAGGDRGDRTGPPGDQAEESVLGAMLLSRDAVTTAIRACDAGHFSKAAHRQIFSAICTLADRGEPADPATVADELRRTGHLDEGRGLAMLIGMQADAAVERALRGLATLAVPIPDHMRHPQVLAQALRPKPRVVRVAPGRLTEITWGKPNRTRSLEAVMYKAFYPDCSNKQLATILSAGQRPRPGGGGYNPRTFRTTMVVARAALGADATGPDLLSTKADGDGRYVLLNGLVLDWNIFKLLVNAASADRSADVDDDTRIRLLSTALDLVGAGGPFSGVSLGSADTFWKWIEVGPSNLRGEMEAHILDAAHWLAELCLERHDFEGVRQAVEKGRSITTLDQSLNCRMLDMELSVHGPAALEAAFARVDAGYRGHAGAEETDDPVAPEVRDHYRDLKIAAGG